MTQLFDVNVLVHAHRVDQAHHRVYRRFLEEAIDASSTFGLSPLVAVGFVRVVTHPRFPNGPTPLPQAVSVIESLVALGHCRWTLPGARHWELTAELCRRCRCAGKLVADAQHAAIAIEHACEWVTRDRDFERFVLHGLRLRILEP